VDNPRPPGSRLPPVSGWGRPVGVSLPFPTHTAETPTGRPAIACGGSAWRAPRRILTGRPAAACLVRPGKSRAPGFRRPKPVETRLAVDSRRSPGSRGSWFLPLTVTDRMAGPRRCGWGRATRPGRTVLPPGGPAGEGQRGPAVRSHHREVRLGKGNEARPYCSATGRPGWGRATRLGRTVPSPGRSGREKSRPLQGDAVALVDACTLCCDKGTTVL